MFTKARILALFAAMTLLAACGSSGADPGRTAGRVASQSFPDRFVLIDRFRPQTFFGGRGYSYTATIYSRSAGFDVIDLPKANADVRRAAHLFCGTMDAAPSRFFAFSRSLPGTLAHRIYFNCE